MGLCAEGASSYTFAALMGHQKAAQMAIFAEKFTAREAERCGFVARVFADAVFHREAEKLLATYQELAPQVGSFKSSVSGKNATLPFDSA